MPYHRLHPPDDLNPFIECYWIVDDDSPCPVVQKIIPDGFTEIIFHFGDPYRIDLGSGWRQQSKALFCGQIKKHFYLENTGISKIFGVKFKPTALTRLYGVNISQFTDHVVDISAALPGEYEKIGFDNKMSFDPEGLAAMISSYLQHALKNSRAKSVADDAIDLIFKNRGMIAIADLHESLAVGERQLERSFRRSVGLSPKFYTRIIRFNYIFSLIQEDKDWMSIVARAGFYDQPHFIRNFKEFTGDEPSAYPFDSVNMANFFLQK